MATPTELAVEIAQRNDRCGHVEEEQVCLRRRDHRPPHLYEPIKKVIPFR